MKHSNPIYRFFCLILVLGLVLPATTAVGSVQDETADIDYTFKFKTIKNADQTRSLMVEFYGEIERDKFPVYEAEISFYTLLNEERILLGTTNSDEEGKAHLQLPRDYNYLKDPDGYITFFAEFKGTDQVEAFEETLSVIDLNLAMQLIEEEGQRSITITAMAVNAAGEEEEIEESDVNFYIKGMINNLMIESNWIEYGEFTFDFPSDIPGDKDGNLLIIAKIEDNEDYGNVVTSATANWGTGPMVSAKKSRKLWTDLGPEWMITVLTLLLVAVWANIIHAIYHLVKIKQEGKNWHKEAT